jgi:cysteine-S-conjugate beta-lyase
MVAVVHAASRPATPRLAPSGHSLPWNSLEIPWEGNAPRCAILCAALRHAHDALRAPRSVYYYQNAEGAGMPPFECWLALRGMKTMKLRMDKSASNAAGLAAFLSSHPRVTAVNYPGLPGSPAAALNAQQATCGGCLLSFTTGDVAVSRAVVERTRLFEITVSFGSTSSLISLPCYMSHASIPAEVRAARGLPDDLVRVSAGVEDLSDLLADLAAALE